MLLHARALGRLRGRLDEPIVFDHFETFEFTQDYPFGVGTAVGARSWFVYTLDPAPHGRSGRSSPAQKQRVRCRPRRSMQGRYAGSTERVLGLLTKLQRPRRSLQLRCDGHRDYRRTWSCHPARAWIDLHTYPNPTRGPKGSPRSRRAVERDRAMFAVDLLHKILRHSMAHHRRETIAFPRRLNAAMERLCLAAVWRNFVKKRSERGAGGSTPAMRLGLASERWSWDRVLSQRLFRDRVELADPWPRLYERRWITPLLPANVAHRLSRAF